MNKEALFHPNLLGIANVKQPGLEPLEHVTKNPEIAEKFLDVVRGRNDIVIMAHAKDPMNDAVNLVQDQLKRLFGVKSLRALHDYNPNEVPQVIADAQGFYFAGGNTWALVANLFANRHSNGQLVDLRPGAIQEPIADDLRNRASDGVGMIGTSAGLMIMGRDIRTCTDPKDYKIDGYHLDVRGLDLIPSPMTFHPHYNVDSDEELQGYASYMEQGHTIIGIPDGGWITTSRIEQEMRFEGPANGAIFDGINGKTTIEPGENVYSLLQP